MADFSDLDELISVEGEFLKIISCPFIILKDLSVCLSFHIFKKGGSFDEILGRVQLKVLSGGSFYSPFTKKRKKNRKNGHFGFGRHFEIFQNPIFLSTYDSYQAVFFFPMFFLDISGL